MVNKYNLELNGQPAGGLFDCRNVNSMPGGHMILECGVGMSRQFYDWITGVFSRQFLRSNGAVSSPSAGTAAERMEFSYGLVSQVVPSWIGRQGRRR
jgi:hypothetical protein